MLPFGELEGGQCLGFTEAVDVAAVSAPLESLVLSRAGWLASFSPRYRHRVAKIATRNRLRDYSFSWYSFCKIISGLLRLLRLFGFESQRCPCMSRPSRSCRQHSSLTT
jgi:hypothetical protein